MFLLEPWRVLTIRSINYSSFFHQTSQIHQAKSEERERREIFLLIVIYRLYGKSSNPLLKVWKHQLDLPLKVSRAQGVTHVSPSLFSLLGAVALFSTPLQLMPFNTHRTIRLNSNFLLLRGCWYAPPHIPIANTHECSRVL